MSGNQHARHYGLLGLVEGRHTTDEGAVVHAHDAFVVGVVRQEQHPLLGDVDHQIGLCVNMAEVVEAEGDATQFHRIEVIHRNIGPSGDGTHGRPLGGPHHAPHPLFSGTLFHRLQHFEMGIDAYPG